MNAEYRQSLEKLQIAKQNYNETLNDFEGAAYQEIRMAEDRVMAIIKKEKR